MGKMKENPRYNLLTFRVSEEEWQEIYDASLKKRMSLSEYLRERLFKW
jgi:hypothetical protein